MPRTDPGTVAMILARRVLRRRRGFAAAVVTGDGKIFEGEPTSCEWLADDKMMRAAVPFLVLAVVVGVAVLALSGRSEEPTSADGSPSAAEESAPFDGTTESAWTESAVERRPLESRGRTPSMDDQEPPLPGTDRYETCGLLEQGEVDRLRDMLDRSTQRFDEQAQQVLNAPDAQKELQAYTLGLQMMHARIACHIAAQLLLEGRYFTMQGAFASDALPREQYTWKSIGPARTESGEMANVIVPMRYADHPDLRVLRDEILRTQRAADREVIDAWNALPFGEREQRVARHRDAVEKFMALSREELGPKGFAAEVERLEHEMLPAALYVHPKTLLARPYR